MIEKKTQTNTDNLGRMQKKETSNKDLQLIRKLKCVYPIRLRKIDGNVVNYKRMVRFNQMFMMKNKNLH